MPTLAEILDNLPTAAERAAVILELFLMMLKKSKYFCGLYLFLVVAITTLSFLGYYRNHWFANSHHVLLVVFILAILYLLWFLQIHRLCGFYDFLLYQLVDDEEILGPENFTLATGAMLNTTFVHGRWPALCLMATFGVFLRIGV